MTDNTFSNPNHPHGFGPTPVWDNAPEQLKALPIWCCWKAVPKENKPGKFGKRPYNATNNGISTDKPQQWLTFDAARQLYEGCPGEFNGIGYLVTKESGIVVGDIDGSTKTWPEGWPPTYTEMSPSGNGLRVLWHCPQGIDRDTQEPIEMYGGNKPQFATFTGWLSDKPEYQTIQHVNGELQTWVDENATQKASQGAPVGAYGPRPDPQWSGQGEMPVIRDLGPAAPEGDQSDKVFDIIRDFLKRRRSPEEVYQILVNSDASWTYYLSKRRGDPVKASDRAWKDVCNAAPGVLVPKLPAVMMAGTGLVPTEPQGVELWNRKLPAPYGDALFSDPVMQALHLTQHQDVDHVWRQTEGCYEVAEKSWLKKLVTRYIGTCWVQTDDGQEYGSPSGSLVNDVVAYLRSHCHQVAASRRTPCWRPGAQGIDPRRLVRFRNGMLDIETRQFQDPSPELFAVNALPHDYVEDAPVPARWHQFLEEVWPGDQASRALLQEIMGYLISGDASMHKIFLLIGASRGGKGTIGRILRKLLGSTAVAAMSLQAAQASYGMQGLIDKLMWLIADARVGKFLDQSAAVEMLTNISGQDPQSIPRKYTGHWQGILEARIVIMANSMPMLFEASQALHNRLVPLKFEVSFAGREDRNLDAKLEAEISGILLWALDGYDRLRSVGHFTETTSSAEMREDFRKLSDPLAGFLGEVVIADPGGYAPAGDVYRAWQRFSRHIGVSVGKTPAKFSTLLKGNLPTVRHGKKRINGKLENVFYGVRFCESYNPAENLHGVDLTGG